MLHPAARGSRQVVQVPQQDTGHGWNLVAFRHAGAPATKPPALARRNRGIPMDTIWG
jgi:hypothetical protein